MARDFVKGRELTALRMNCLAADVAELARVCGVQAPARRASGMKRRDFEPVGELVLAPAGEAGEQVGVELRGCELLWAGGAALLPSARLEEPLERGVRYAVAAGVRARWAAHKSVRGVQVATPVGYYLEARKEGEEEQIEAWLAARVDVPPQKQEGDSGAGAEDGKPQALAVEECVPWLCEQGVVPFSSSNALAANDEERVASVLPAPEPEQVISAYEVWQHVPNSHYEMVGALCLCGCLDMFGYLRLRWRFYEAEEESADASAGNE